MKISYAITVCDEYVEVQNLITFLLEHKRKQDEIVVLLDITKPNSKLVEEYLRSHCVNGAFNWIKNNFKGHFAEWKNHLTSHCHGDYIFQIDADEIPHEYLIQALPEIIEMNPDNEVFLVPRVNTVSGLTQEYISKWRWNVDEEDRINWPDYQWRIWKNKPEIKWVNKVHERLEGFKTYAPLGAMVELSLIHPKTIERQVKQNDYYESLSRSN